MTHPLRMTKREREVVALIADGLTNKEIADKLHLSAYTVKSHIHNILEKMVLNTRIQSEDVSIINGSISPKDE